MSLSALTSRIKSARKALGDDGKAQRYIRNERGRGYRFVGDVEPTGDGDSATSTGEPAPSESMLGPGAGATPRTATAAAPRLVGRDDAIEDVFALALDGVLVTIVGPGGIGKTSLSRAVAPNGRQADRSRGCARCLPPPGTPDSPRCRSSAGAPEEVGER